MLGCLLPPGGESYGQAPGPWAAWGMGMDVGRTGHPTILHAQLPQIIHFLSALSGHTPSLGLCVGQSSEVPDLMFPSWMFP